jgi:hypothetical protein
MRREASGLFLCVRCKRLMCRAPLAQPRQTRPPQKRDVPGTNPGWGTSFFARAREARAPLRHCVRGGGTLFYNLDVAMPRGRLRRRGACVSCGRSRMREVRRRHRRGYEFDSHRPHQQNCSTSGEVPRLSTWRGGFESRAVHQPQFTTFGDVAQSREQPPCKRQVRGLNSHRLHQNTSRCSAAGPARLLREQEAGGSNPPGETNRLRKASTPP